MIFFEQTVHDTYVCMKQQKKEKRKKTITRTFIYIVQLSAEQLMKKYLL